MKGFKQGAYIFCNTQEIRNYLETIGYVKDNRFGVPNGDCILTYGYDLEDGVTVPHYIECTPAYFEGGPDVNWCANRINCGTDIENFKKIVSEKID